MKEKENIELTVDEMIQIAYDLEHGEYCDEGCYGCCGDDRYEY